MEPVYTRLHNRFYIMGDNVYKLITTILLSVCGFFCVKTFNEISDIKDDVEVILIATSADRESIKNNTKNIDRLNDKVFPSHTSAPPINPPAERPYAQVYAFVRPEDVDLKLHKWPLL